MPRGVRGSKSAPWSAVECESKLSLQLHTKKTIVERALDLYCLDLSTYKKQQAIEYFLDRQFSMGIVLGDYGPNMWEDDICELEYHSPKEIRARYKQLYKEELDTKLSKEKLIELFIKKYDE